MSHFLMVTDLDATLLGNSDFLRHFNFLFERHRNKYGSKLVYATGRSRQLYQELEDPGVGLLVPDKLITSVGSEIYTVRQESDGQINKEIDDEWTAQLSENWDLEKVSRITREYEKRGQLKRQPETEQGPLKASFHLEPQHRYILEEIEQKLKEQNIYAQIIYSSNRDVDILPQRSGKGNALNHVREKLEMSCEHTVACGDSGNDISLFSDTRIYGIIVGNARQELKDWYRENERERGNLYLARKSCAEGILDGLKYFCQRGGMSHFCLENE
jgi:sucrose-6-phosphatase